MNHTVLSQAYSQMRESVTPDLPIPHQNPSTIRNFRTVQKEGTPERVRSVTQPDSSSNAKTQRRKVAERKPFPLASLRLRASAALRLNKWLPGPALWNFMAVPGGATARELDEKAVCRDFRHAAGDGGDYTRRFCNLDAILSVGLRAMIGGLPK